MRNPVSIRQVPWTTLLLAFALAALTGCGGAKTKQKEDFFTSGSREADQRATQRMAKEEQLSGTGEGAGEKGVKEAKGGDQGAPAKVEGKMTLFERLGGEQGINGIVDDFTVRALEDPRVNWQRKGVKSSGWFRRERSVAWNDSPENVATLKKHMIQFLSLATGGPAQYDGKSIKATHADMNISNPEFDAVIGDLKASLDKLRIPNQEQKELIAIVESTRPQIVTVR